MTTIFEDAPKVDGIRGDMAKVTHIDGRVLIRAIAMTPDRRARWPLGSLRRLITRRASNERRTETVPVLRGHAHIE